MALQAYKGLRPFRGQLSVTGNIIRQSLPAAMPPSKTRTIETTAQVFRLVIQDTDRAILINVCIKTSPYAGCTDQRGQSYS